MKFEKDILDRLTINGRVTIICEDDSEWVKAIRHPRMATDWIVIVPELDGIGITAFMSCTVTEVKDHILRHWDLEGATIL